jgi:hypothetical protein
MRTAKPILPASAPEVSPASAGSRFLSRRASGDGQAINTPLKLLRTKDVLLSKSRFPKMAGFRVNPPPAKPRFEIWT